MNAIMPYNVDRYSSVQSMPDGVGDEDEEAKRKQGGQEQSSDSSDAPPPAPANASTPAPNFTQMREQGIARPPMPSVQAAAPATSGFNPGTPDQYGQYTNPYGTPDFWNAGQAEAWQQALGLYNADRDHASAALSDADYNHYIQSTTPASPTFGQTITQDDQGKNVYGGEATPQAQEYWQMVTGIGNGAITPPAPRDPQPYEPPGTGGVPAGGVAAGSVVAPPTDGGHIWMRPLGETVQLTDGTRRYGRDDAPPPPSTAGQSSGVMPGPHDAPGPAVPGWEGAHPITAVPGTQGVTDRIDRPAASPPATQPTTSTPPSTSAGTLPTGGAPGTFSPTDASGMPDILNLLINGVNGQGAGSAVQQATQRNTLNLLDNPSPYGLDQVKDAFNWEAGTIDDSYALQRKQLGEQMARRGLGSSTIYGGNLDDLNIGQRSATTTLAHDLGQDYAKTLGDYQSSAINTGNTVGTTAQNNGLDWLKQLMGYGQQGFENDLATDVVNQNANSSWENYILGLINAGYTGA